MTPSPTRRAHLPAAGRAAGRQPPPSHRAMHRAMFYSHLWLGIIVTLALVAISVTGILLNHKRGLGLMPDVGNPAARPLETSISLDRLASIALHATSSTGASPREVDHIDRMDVRPRDGYVKVRLRDNASTEVTVDLATGRVLHIGRRGDVFLEKLHSGEIFGGRWVLLSDFAAGGLLITLASGVWLWLVPKLRRGSIHEDDA